MASPICLRCLSRSLSHLNTPTTLGATRHAAAAFSTSSALSDVNKKKGSIPARATQKGGTLRLQKNSPVASTGRKIAPGERKAQRKKIVLSNDNALAVPGLRDLSAESLAVTGGAETALGELKGRVLGLSEETVESLRALGSFSPTQAWHLFKRPATLIRQETAQVAAQLAQAEAGGRGGGPAAVREIVHGEKGSGKSVLLLQAHAMALVKKWVVIHVPDANEVTNGHTAFQAIRTERGRQYIQPKYTAQLLGNLARANKAVLDELQLRGQPSLPIPVQANMSLSRFAELGAHDPALAWPVWTALWSELTAASDPSKPGQTRPPILITADGVDHLMRASAYLDPKLQPIHAHDLTLAAFVVDALAGATPLPNGGMVLAATTASNRAAAPTLDYCLARRQAEQDAALAPNPPRRPAVPPRWDPYVAKDARVEAALAGLTHVLQLRGLSRAEARGVMEYYAQSGILRASVTEALVSEKWSLAGGGIVGQLERSAAVMGM